MIKWEIKVYGYGVGHVYTMYSDAKLSSVKQNMARRLKLHIDAGHAIAMIVVRDLREESIVHIREILKIGKPRYRIWRKIGNLAKDWDDASSSKFKAMEIKK